MPGLDKVAAMIDGDAVKPGARRRLPAKLSQAAHGFKEDVVCGVLGLLRIAQKAQGQVKNGAAVLIIEAGEFLRQNGLFGHTLRLGHSAYLFHENLHRN